MRPLAPAEARGRTVVPLKCYRGLRCQKTEVAPEPYISNQKQRRGGRKKMLTNEYTVAKNMHPRKMQLQKKIIPSLTLVQP